MNKKTLLILLIALAVFVTLVGCNATQEQAQDPVWSITIEGASSDSFTDIDYAGLTEVSIDVVQVTKDGTETPMTVTGVILKDVLEVVGATDYTSVTVEASDGYAKDYTADIVNDEMTVLVTLIDGEPISAENGYVQTVAGNQPSNMWIKMLTKLTINE